MTPRAKASPSLVPARRLIQMDRLNVAVASLELEQNAVRRAPTWPREPGALRGLIAALLLPIVIWLIQCFLSRWVEPDPTAPWRMG